MVERLFLAGPQGCLRFVIVVFPDHTHLLFLCLTGFALIHSADKNTSCVQITQTGDTIVYQVDLPALLM